MVKRQDFMDMNQQDKNQWISLREHMQESPIFHGNQSIVKRLESAWKVVGLRTNRIS